MEGASRLLGFLLSLTLLVGGAAALADDPAASSSVDVRPDSLQVDHQAREALFEGNVEAVYGKLQLRCDRMRVSYTEEGTVSELFAEGHVSVKRADARATAQSARLAAGQGLLVLQGKPVLFKGPHRIEGSRVEVHLATGEIRVVDARGQFQLDLGAKP